MKRIVILLLVITGLYIIYTQALQFDWFNSDNNNKDGKASITDNIDMIEVNISSINTMIIPEDRKDLKVVYTGKQKLTVAEKGDKVEVSLKSKGFDWFNWFTPSEKKKLKIFIPEKYDRNMNIKVGSGNVNFTGQSKSNPVKLEELTIDIGSGNMQLQNLVIKRFEHNGASGNVDIDSLKTETGSFDLSSGRLDVKHYTGAIKANVASGKLNFQLDKLTDPIDIEVTSGSVGLNLPKNADFTLNGDVTSGNITCDIPLTSKENKHRSIKGKHGSGKYKINLELTSGNIHIK
ncbi:LiaG family protein [Neobacillus soli]|uniref:LiaG family protein n=1 Tax=Neobacillus soli TaxID=220688 RepID=UPI000826B738|nr:DUF4097 domain-containing protein [Neobacillus soli]